MSGCKCKVVLILNWLQLLLFLLMLLMFVFLCGSLNDCQVQYLTYVSLYEILWSFIIEYFDIYMIDFILLL